MNKINISILRIVTCLTICIFFLPSLSGICAEFRKQTLPGEEAVFKEKALGFAPPPVKEYEKEEKVVPQTVYDRFEDKVKKVKKDEIPNIVKFYEQKKDKACKAKDSVIEKHYSKLLEILRKYK